MVGKVEEAKGGTLFLDEIADLSPDAQARRLRFLNDQTYERVVEATERKADVRGTEGAAGPRPSPPRVGGSCTLEELEREHIARWLSSGKTVGEIARLLGIDPTTLHRKRKRYRLA